MREAELAEWTDAERTEAAGLYDEIRRLAGRLGLTSLDCFPVVVLEALRVVREALAAELEARLPGGPVA